MNRREFIESVMASGGAACLASAGLIPQQAMAQSGTGDIDEPMPTSPLILSPFRDLLPVPKPLAPSDPNLWTDPTGASLPPDPNFMGGIVDGKQVPHQYINGVFPSNTMFYRIQTVFRPHRWTTSPVRGPDGRPRQLPASWIMGFNGTFPGPMIRAFYGEPTLVRFENLVWQGSSPAFGSGSRPAEWGDYGVPSVLTHQHNGHTASESDGNPFQKPDGYDSWYYGGNGQWFYDNLYLNFPAGDDDREKQSSLWFHDHRLDNTGSNVYKGQVGLYIYYDPVLDPGDETRGLRLPGVPQPDGSVAYDIYLALYDLRLDDGLTPHMGLNVGSSLDYGILQDGKPHPENWGKSFYAHYENTGFVGDIFTVNGKAYPYLPVKRRKYRVRFLDASISRQYDLQLRKGVPRLKKGLQGQWELRDSQLAMRWVQIASEGGLLPRPIVRNTFRIAPAKRREFIVDFSRYIDGSPTRSGDVIYLTNTLEMKDGRKASDTLAHGVPMMAFVIDGNEPAPDNSVIPSKLRALPPVPPPSELATLTHRRFVLERGNSMWLINGAPFDHTISYADIPQGAAEVWNVVNAGGGWTHPMHMHHEEHQILSRNGRRPPQEDVSKEDVVLLDQGEDVAFYRKFRTFKGKYVAHCHNLAHEDHAMMFGWQIV